eukprot:GHVH01011007.1.p1 GENE.GHVH01011007.1~~GHVH01011007.1.p1  ORF type:complete len:336 (+),score=46.37 GHVH01011007.1:24-1010(+)
MDEQIEIGVSFDPTKPQDEVVGTSANKRERGEPNRLNFPQRKRNKVDDTGETEEAEKEKHFRLTHDADTENKTLFVKNFDISIKSDHIEAQFISRGASQISSVRIPRHFDQTPKPFCYVEFETVQSAEDALAAIKANPICVHKRTWFVAMSQPTKSVFEPDVIFVSKLDVDTPIHELEEMLRKVASTDLWLKDYVVKDIRLPHEASSGLSKGYGYIEFEPIIGDIVELHVANLFSKVKDVKLDSGKTIELKQSVPLKDHRWHVGNKNLASCNITEKRHAKAVELAEDTVLVKNMSFKMKEEDLEMLFEEHAGAVAQGLPSYNWKRRKI